MNAKRISIALLSLAMASCSGVNPTVNGDSTSAYGFTVDYSIVNEVAYQTFSHGFFGKGFEMMEMPKTPLVAGDYFEINYTGELIVQETYPCTYLILHGEVKETRFVRTDVHSISTKEFNLDHYLLKDIEASRVILDQDGSYVELDKYAGDELCLTRDMGYYENHKCPEGAFCEDLPFVIAGIYAFNPIIQENP